jgi:hypothetical protein
MTQDEIEMNASAERDRIEHELSDAAPITVPYDKLHLFGKLTDGSEVIRAVLEYQEQERERINAVYEERKKKKKNKKTKKTKKTYSTSRLKSDRNLMWLQIGLILMLQILYWCK